MNDLYRETAIRYGAPADAYDCTSPINRGRAQTQSDHPIYSTPSEVALPTRSRSAHSNRQIDDDRTEMLAQVFCW